MTGARFRLIGLTMLTGAALAVACGGDDSGGDDDDDQVTNTSGPTTTTNATSQTQTATSSQTTSTISNTTGTSTTGAGGTGGTGGSAGGGGMCQDEGMPTTGGAGEGGAGGEGPMPDSGYTFEEPSEIEDWAMQARNDDCDDCVDTGSLAWSCAVMEVSVTWPADADTVSQKVVLENILGQNALADLTGRTVMASIRMTSDAVQNNGYDIDLGLNDYGGDSDWTYHGTCWSGSTDCPSNRHNTELWGPDDGWKAVSLDAGAAESPDFDESSIIKMALQISTKWWDTGTFDYASAPVTFEVGMYVW